ncbi:unnamed protein product [Coffea canephora]|uniref:Retrotransposon Copia-like N-terminal domain-containing protein n=1 Tax=Coffea canephora TaxID=49390 RepID=A0A068UXG4_COFCA|nr:unnamed protein product [Coffea canephora]
MSKITDHKLNNSNYLDWSKTVRLYLRSIDKDNHLTDDPPKDGSRQTWLREDARLFLQIRNSIDSEVFHLILKLLNLRFFPVLRSHPCKMCLVGCFAQRIPSLFSPAVLLLVLENSNTKVVVKELTLGDRMQKWLCVTIVKSRAI